MTADQWDARGQFGRVQVLGQVPHVDGRTPRADDRSSGMLCRGLGRARSSSEHMHAAGPGQLLCSIALLSQFPFNQCLDDGQVARYLGEYRDLLHQEAALSASIPMISSARRTPRCASALGYGM